MLGMSDSNRPYRVGMARPAQRYIEPDEIYEGLQRGAPTRIPVNFPFTWTPVNGLGEHNAIGSPLDDVFNNLVRGGQQVVDNTKNAAQDSAGKAVEDFINSTPGKQFLDKVKGAAAEGVTGVVKSQGMNLILLAVAGGAVGGTLSAKLGKTGTVLACLVGGWAAYRIMNAVAPPATPVKAGR